eukprot:10148482-Karenia_brevis.AAC.1
MVKSKEHWGARQRKRRKGKLGWPCSLVFFSAEHFAKVEKAGVVDPLEFWHDVGEHREFAA